MRTGTVRWKIVVWEMKGVSNNEQEICPISSEEDSSHSLLCEGRYVWWQQILNRRFRSIDAEMGIKRRV
jgi:hypothetical protein